MKLDPFANLTPAAGKRGFARKANSRLARRDRRLVAKLDQVLHFSTKRRAPERVRLFEES